MNFVKFQMRTPCHGVGILTLFEDFEAGGASRTGRLSINFTRHEGDLEVLKLCCIFMVI